MRRFLRLVGWGTLIFLCLLLLPLIGVGLNCGPFSSVTPVQTNTASEIPNTKADDIDYVRSEEQTYLTLPEWYIVYATDEYAAFIRQNRPSGFPYFQSLWQYWQSYYGVCAVTRAQYAFNGGYHQMLVVIGVSFTAENIIKGIYENTVGRATELISSRELSEEDAYARKVSQEYGDFMHNIPWFEFPFTEKLTGLWRETSWWGPNVIRKWERKLALTAEYGSKAIYGGLLSQVTHAMFPPEILQIRVGARGVSPAVLKEEPLVQIDKTLNAQTVVLMLPRYEDFTKIMPRLAKQGVQFLEIAGNDEILLTAIAPSTWTYTLKEGQFLFAMPLPTQPDRQRIAVKSPILQLHLVLNQLADQGVTLEHLYDY